VFVPIFALFRFFLIFVGILQMFLMHESPSKAVTFEHQIKDVSDAFVWLTQNLSKFGIENPKIIVGGHSAGGHLALNFCLRPEKYLPPNQIDLVRFLSGCVGVSGVYHLGRMNKNLFLRYWYIVGAFGNKKEDLREFFSFDTCKKTFISGSFDQCNI